MSFLLYRWITNKSFKISIKKKVLVQTFRNLCNAFSKSNNPWASFLHCLQMYFKQEGSSSNFCLCSLLTLSQWICNHLAHKSQNIWVCSQCSWQMPQARTLRGLQWGLMYAIYRVDEVSPI